MSFRHILVSLDGSRFAEMALPPAVRLARTAHANLHLALAHQPVAAMVGMGDSFPPPGFDDEARQRETAYLADRTGELLANEIPEVAWAELEGPAGPALVEEAGRLEADLMVMATHGRGAMGRLWLGSVADYVIRHLTIPVLLLRPGRRAEPAPAGALRSILVALDLSRDSEAILEPVVALAQLNKGHVTLVHVVESFLGYTAPAVPYPTPTDPILIEASRVQAQRQLDHIADRLRLRGVSVSCRVVSETSPASGLLRALGEPNFDLIALTTHGTGGFRRLLLGSVADKVIRGATKPVLVLRPNQLA